MKCNIYTYIKYIFNFLLPGVLTLKEREEEEEGEVRREIE